MTLAADTLPDDPGTLKAMLIAERLRAERLEQIIKELQRHRFGRRAETLPEDQLLLGLEDVEQGVAADEIAEGTSSASLKTERARRRRANRGSLPTYLPRIETIVDIENKTGPCCRHALHVIGEDVAERLDILPAHFRVIVTRRPRYGCRACDGVVVQAPAPARLIEGGIPTEATVEQVLVSKFGDHLPLYRQAHIYARQGVHLDRSTLADWVGRAAFLLLPVHERLLGHLKASSKLFADETTAPVLDPGHGRTKTGQLFAYAQDGRPSRDATRPPSSSYMHPTTRPSSRSSNLHGFAGTLQVDGYASYRALAEKGEVKLAFCWSHVRSRFYELVAAGPAPIGTKALERIAVLYRIETEIQERSAEARRLVRQERTRPLLDALEAFLREKLTLIIQKSKLAEAIRYALSRWEGLSRFLDDGRVELDNNTVERSIRPLALTRKNALFAGSDAGARH